MYDPRLKAKIDSPLYVVTAISNSQRYHSRYWLYEKFAKHVEQSGARLITVETAFGERSHVVTHPFHPDHIQLRTAHELWIKENMLNIAISHLPSDWRYVAWIDADIEFLRDDWVIETLHQLQHYHVVQMWSECIDMLPNFEINQYHASFMKCYEDYLNDRLPVDANNMIDGYYVVAGKRGIYWHAGFAWAARREAIDALGGLIDWSVCGANDHHMALALVGRLKKSIHGDTSAAFKASMEEWEQRALLEIRKNIGYVPGTIKHSWHGAKTNRKYKDRWQILVDSQFDPNIDLKKDWQGLYQLTDRRGEKSVLLRDGLREYFKSRNEDSIDPNPDERSMKPMMIDMSRSPATAPAKTLDDDHTVR